MRRAGQGDRGKLWIIAANQTGGRGRQGRSWSSPPGNVYASLLLIDAVQPALASQLGFVAGVALVRVVESLVGAAGAQVSIKWPNDLVHQGAKLAGILVEGARCPDGRFACVLGFGVNRRSHPEGLPYAATDLFSLGAGRPTIDDVVAALSAELDEILQVWDRGRNFDRLRKLWLDHALPSGTAMAVSSQGSQIRGTFDTIDERGRLILTTEAGAVKIDAGDVFLMDKPVQFAG